MSTYFFSPRLKTESTYSARKNLKSKKQAFPLLQSGLFGPLLPLLRTKEKGASAEGMISGQRTAGNTPSGADENSRERRIPPGAASSSWWARQQVKHASSGKEKTTVATKLPLSDRAGIHSRTQGYWMLKFTATSTLESPAPDSNFHLRTASSAATASM